MKISVTDKRGAGIMQDFAKAIGTHIQGRFLNIPESKGAGYLTGFSWGSDLRIMIRNYHLKEDVVIEWIQEPVDEQETIVFLISGIFPSLAQPFGQLLFEQANILICKQAISTFVSMPSNTAFRSITIAASKTYLYQLFGQIEHPIVVSILEAKDNFVFETNVSTALIDNAQSFLHCVIPNTLEKPYYKLKCEELLFYIFTLLLQRETIPTTAMHIEDIKAIYAVKERLQSHLDQPPHIASIAKEAGMSEPKLRKLFKQTFGKGVFQYYQSGRMQRAAQLLKEKRLTVSEVGYQLGFTNLSHFSRVFEKHFGKRPKKYSM